MLNKITMRDVASYKSPAYLETDRKVNLIYGLNGTGKSVLSNFLYDLKNPEYASCSIEGIEKDRIHVYNQAFIRDYFFESGQLAGIFTLSKENKEAEKKIEIASTEIQTLVSTKEGQIQRKDESVEQLAASRRAVEDKAWAIKRNYSGGDRVLEFCLEGLKGNKSTLCNYLLQTKRPTQEPDKSIGELKRDVELLEGDGGKKCDPLNMVSISTDKIELDVLFQKNIVGNENSSVAGLIQHLKNSDWVRQGLTYLPDEIEQDNVQCPFCQEPTISEQALKEIYGYFDDTYESDVRKLRGLLHDYEVEVAKIPALDEYEKNIYVGEILDVFREKYSDLTKALTGNISLIKDKLTTPSKTVKLADTSDAVTALNEVIQQVNVSVDTHNRRIENKQESLSVAKELFWARLRWDYDAQIAVFEAERARLEQDIGAANEAIQGIDTRIDSLTNQIGEYQKETVNIEAAVRSINGGLVELGIDDFHIERHAENLYRVSRKENQSDVFRTLSEGEKMVISFLYFVERCKGKASQDDVPGKKIVVIDDPISSLSHIFVFNIGELIKNEFLRSAEYEQVFVLTHSLYFFYEITDINHERRKRDQKLFRVTKNSDGTQFLDMTYEEIQSDYQAYWQVVKDKNQPPALIANCMRNIVEYFFNFIEKRDFNNLFEKSELQGNRYQAFRRYMNRESHSLGQNIFDFKEFDYDVFYEALGLLFDKCGYREHYEKMIK